MGRGLLGSRAATRPRQSRAAVRHSRFAGSVRLSEGAEAAGERRVRDPPEALGEAAACHTPGGPATPRC